MKDHYNTNELVSVIIPCFNHGVFLEEAVNSVLNSNYSPIEIIIVDDGSYDNTLEVASDIMHKYHNVSYYYQSNQGPSVARNNGISKANGFFILPLDADDKISDKYIAQAVKKLKSDKEIKIVYCNAEMFGLKNGPWKLKDFSKRRIASHNMIFSCAMFRKNDWQKVGGYSTELKYCDEDWEFWISLLKTGGYAYRLQSVGFYYRILPDSRSRSMTKETKKSAMEFINRKHHSFMVSQLKGPLRTHRSLSVLINTFSNLFGMFKITPKELYYDESGSQRIHY